MPVLVFRLVIASVATVLCLLAQGTSGQDLGDERPRFVEEYLAKFKEDEVLQGAETYRIVVWPTFYSPIAVRIERNGIEAKLEWKRLSGQGGYEVGGIDKSESIPISLREFNRVGKLVQEARLSEMPTRETRFDGKPGDLKAEICLDGSNWIIQSLIDTELHTVVRTCPEDKRLHRIVFELVKLSRLKIKRSELF